MGKNNLEDGDNMKLRNDSAKTERTVNVVGMKRRKSNSEEL
jgi:hypothetical protein